MVRVAHERTAAQILREQGLAKSDRLLGSEGVDSVGAPRLLARLDDDGGEIVAELIGMDLQPPMLGLFEAECKGGKCLRRAEPDEAALADGDVRLEHPGMARAD